MSKTLTKPFILILVALVLLGCYWVFKPFLTEMLVAAILVSVFYTPYVHFTKFLKGRNRLAAILMCLLLLILIILPTVKLIAYAGSQSMGAYNSAVTFFESHHTVKDILNIDFFHHGIFSYLNLSKYNITGQTFQKAVLTILKQSSNWLISGASIILKSTTNFIISLLIIIVTMYFFFVDGDKMVKRIMELMPWPQKYNDELFHKFQVVSQSTFLSSFAASLAQGIVAAIGFWIVGFSPLLAGVLVALFSFLPLGSSMFYIPMAIFYLLIGSIWQGIFILLWGTFIISTVDNVVRAYMIKDEAEINPIFVLLSILGGISIFGFWGVILGPLVVALAVTVFHIYELEFKEDLSKNLSKKIKKSKI